MLPYLPFFIHVTPKLRSMFYQQFFCFFTKQMTLSSDSKWHLPPPPPCRDRRFKARVTQSIYPLCRIPWLNRHATVFSWTWAAWQLTWACQSMCTSSHSRNATREQQTPEGKNGAPFEIQLETPKKQERGRIRDASASPDCQMGPVLCKQKFPCQLNLSFTLPQTCLSAACSSSNTLTTAACCRKNEFGLMGLLVCSLGH